MALSKVGSWAAIVGTAALVGGGAGYLGTRLGAPEAAVSAEAEESRNDEGSQAQRPSGPRAPAERTGYTAPLPRPVSRAARPVPVLPDYQGQLVELTPEQRLQQARAMVRSSDPQQRSEGLVALLSESQPEAVEAARGMIRDRDADVAPHAARVVGTGGQALADQEIATLQEMVQDATLTPEQRAGLNAAVLGSIPDGPERLAWMDKALSSDAVQVRGSTVAAVVPMPTAQAVPLLAKALSDSDERVANGALNALVHMHGGDAALGKDPAAWARWLDEKEAARERAVAEELAMRNPVIKNSPEAPVPVADPDERLDPPLPPPTEAQ